MSTAEKLLLAELIVSPTVKLRWSSPARKLFKKGRKNFRNFQEFFMTMFFI